MDLQTLTRFFMWCTILNSAIFALWVVFQTLTPDLTYRIQHAFMPLPRETYDVAIYTLFGVFKLLILVFNLGPWIALVLIA